MSYWRRISQLPYKHLTSSTPLVWEASSLGMSKAIELAGTILDKYSLIDLLNQLELSSTTHVTLSLERHLLLNMDCPQADFTSLRWEELFRALLAERLVNFIEPPKQLDISLNVLALIWKSSVKHRLVVTQICLSDEWVTKWKGFLSSQNGAFIPDKAASHDKKIKREGDKLRSNSFALLWLPRFLWSIFYNAIRPVMLSCQKNLFLDNSAIAPAFEGISFSLQRIMDTYLDYVPAATINDMPSTVTKWSAVFPRFSNHSSVLRGLANSYYGQWYSFSNNLSIKDLSDLLFLVSLFRDSLTDTVKNCLLMYKFLARFLVDLFSCRFKDLLHKNHPLHKAAGICHSYSNAGFGSWAADPIVLLASRSISTKEESSVCKGGIDFFSDKEELFEKCIELLTFVSNKILKNISELNNALLSDKEVVSLCEIPWRLKIISEAITELCNRFPAFSSGYDIYYNRSSFVNKRKPEPSSSAFGNFFFLSHMPSALDIQKKLEILISQWLVEMIEPLISRDSFKPVKEIAFPQSGRIFLIISRTYPSSSFLEQLMMAHILRLRVDLHTPGSHFKENRSFYRPEVPRMLVYMIIVYPETLDGLFDIAEACKEIGERAITLLVEVWRQIGEPHVVGTLFDLLRIWPRENLPEAFFPRGPVAMEMMATCAFRARRGILLLATTPNVPKVLVIRVFSIWIKVAVGTHFQWMPKMPCFKEPLPDFCTCFIWRRTLILLAVCFFRRVRKGENDNSLNSDDLITLENMIEIIIHYLPLTIRVDAEAPPLHLFDLITLRYLAVSLPSNSDSVKKLQLILEQLIADNKKILSSKKLVLTELETEEERQILQEYAAQLDELKLTS